MGLFLPNYYLEEQHFYKPMRPGQAEAVFEPIRVAEPRNAGKPIDPGLSGDKKGPKMVYLISCDNHYLQNLSTFFKKAAQKVLFHWQIFKIAYSIPR